MFNWNKYISINPKVQLGKPVIKNTRITVELIIEKLSTGETYEQIIESYPHINKKHILACLSYASNSLKNELAYNYAS